MSTWPLRSLVIALAALVLLGLLLPGILGAPDTSLQQYAPALARLQTTVSAVERWGSDDWQEALRGQLADSGLAVRMWDGAGRLVVQTDSAPDTPADQRIVVIDAGQVRGIVDVYVLASGDTTWVRTAGIPIVITQILLLLGALALIDRQVLRPLASVEAAARAIGSGDLDVRLQPSRIRELRAVSVAFGQMGDALRASLRRQADLEQERRMLISAVAHDLRTPLFALRGYLEGLERGVAATPDKVAQYVRLSRQKADVLERLIADLFAYTRLEYLDQTVERQPVDLAELLRTVVQDLEPLAGQRQITIEVQIPSGELWIAGDAMLLSRALSNVVENALRFTPPGEVVRVSGQTDGLRARFTVADSGPGIAAHDLPHIFEPMYRADVSRNRETGGAGLGLAIAQRIVRLHDGTLAARNLPEGGAAFDGELPLRGDVSLVSRGSEDHRDGASQNKR